VRAWPRWLFGFEIFEAPLASPGVSRRPRPLKEAIHGLNVLGFAHGTQISQRAHHRLLGVGDDYVATWNPPRMNLRHFAGAVPSPVEGARIWPVDGLSGVFHLQACETC
jgi:hypothetical protein